MKTCHICAKQFEAGQPLSEFAQAGEWLAQEIWGDLDELCPLCLENRGKLAMMYCHDVNT